LARFFMAHGVALRYRSETQLEQPASAAAAVMSRWTNEYNKSINARRTTCTDDRLKPRLLITDSQTRRAVPRLHIRQIKITKLCSNEGQRQVERQAIVGQVNDQSNMLVIRQSSYKHVAQTADLKSLRNSSVKTVTDR